MIAIVGNGDNEFKESDYKCIIRMNFTMSTLSPQDRSVLDNPNRRTDILCLSHKIERQVFEKIKPRFVMWMTPRRDFPFMSEYEKSFVDAYYPLAMWEALSLNLLGARPSTGCMAVDFFSRITDDWELIGFNFTPSVHDMEKEKEYIMERIKIQSTDIIMKVLKDAR